MAILKQLAKLNKPWIERVHESGITLNKPHLFFSQGQWRVIGKFSAPHALFFDANTWCLRAVKFKERDHYHAKPAPVKVE